MGTIFNQKALKLTDTRLDHAWAYEVEPGIEVYCGLRDEDPICTRISWKQIESALSRYRKYKRLREAKLAKKR